MTASCLCGQVKDRSADYCLSCWESVPSAMRAEWLRLYRVKRGSPSYHAKTREIARAVLANIDVAKAVAK